MATTKPKNVPARRRTPRLNVALKSGFKHNGDGHGEPIRATQLEGPAERFAEADAHRQADGMAKRRRIQAQIGAQNGEPSTKAERPGLPGIALCKLCAARGRRNGGQFGSGSHLPESRHPSGSACPRRGRPGTPIVRWSRAAATGSQSDPSRSKGAGSSVIGFGTLHGLADGGQYSRQKVRGSGRSVRAGCATSSGRAPFSRSMRRRRRPNVSSESRIRSA